MRRSHSSTGIWSNGTRDIAGRDSEVVGTRELGRRICGELERLLAAEAG